MKHEDLFRAIGETDEDLLDENVIPARRRNIFPIVVSIAACIAVVVGTVWIMPQKIPTAKNPEDTDRMTIETIAGIEEYQASPTAMTETVSQISTETAYIPEIDDFEPEQDVFTIEDLSDETEDVKQIHYPEMPVFMHGKYQAVDESGEVRYFWFDDDGGRFEDGETGMGLGFTLEYLEVYNEDGTTDAIFHIGSVDDNTFAKIAHNENGTLLVKWQDGAKEIFTYLGESDE